MADFNLNGLGVALVTPFLEDLSIDYKGVDRLIDHVISGGCDYLVILGTTAETPTLTLSEKKELSRYICEKVNGRIPLVIGIGGNSTKAVVEDLKEYDLTGFSGILSVTPYYNKPTQEGLFLHYKAIADASPLPIILYNVPGRTGVNLSSRTTLKLAAYSSKICGIKEASGKIDQCKEIIENAPAGFYLVSGDDSSTCELMSLGAVGVVSVLANALPKQVKYLVDQCKNSDEMALSTHSKLLPLMKHLFEDGNPSGVKALLSEMGLIKNILRLPLVPVSSEVKKKIKEDLKSIVS